MNDKLGVDFSGLVIFAGEQCPPCHRAMQWLNAYKIPYRPYKVDGDKDLIIWLQQVTGQRTVPQFFYNGAWIDRNFPGVQAMVESGELKPQS
jgi:glutaredoxin